VWLQKVFSTKPSFLQDCPPNEEYYEPPLLSSLTPPSTLAFTAQSMELVGLEIMLYYSYSQMTGQSCKSKMVETWGKGQMSCNRRQKS